MSTFLHKLIGSLSTSEKIYFKRSAGTHGRKDNKNYLRIYEALEPKEYVGDAALKNLYSNSSMGRHLPSECNYLTEKLLLSLFNFNLNSSKRNQIQKGIILIEGLIKKGFRKQALKKLKYIKKTADKYEELTMLLRLIELEEVILFKEGIIGYKEQLETLKEQRSTVTAKIQNLNDYHLLREEVREAQFTESLAIDDKARFNEICSDALVLDSRHCLTLKAKEHWYYIQVLTNYLKWDFDKGLFYAHEYLQFTRQNKHIFSTSKLLPTLSNFIYHSALTRDKASFNEGLEMLKELSYKEQISDAYFSYIRLTRNLEFAYYTKNLEAMKVFLEPTANLLKEHRDDFEEAQLQYLFMNVARTAIVLGKYKVATLVMNEWMQTGVLSYRKVQARLFLLMVHFKLGYFDLVQSELIQLKKMEKKYLRDQVLIKAFYRFFNAMSKHPGKSEKPIEQLRQALKSLSEKRPGYFDFIAFDYYQWSLELDRKIPSPI